jgi:archaellin
MVGQGDLIKVSIDLTDLASAGVFNSQTVDIKIMPAYGQTTLVSFYTPEVFNSEVINLA